ncbi:unnamed protein product [Larinioides sclopetarius]|uniref:Uncharacterized protein n=1 Tax=Larinioides sclopetarius TaxID=280406 RepID=A0AAV1YRQ0_9ARAC
MDLQGDEELEALRLAALATLKTKKKDSESYTPDNISKVSTLITSKPADHQNYSKKDSSDHPQGSVYGNQPSWRNSQSSRRGRGRQFPKGNQRSNLIVITPVNLCNKTDEKETPPQLVLPQHKWCQSVNEDSSSPKSYRRIGPTRFNRHGSDSESSDESDYNDSDNDSYSNDTVLQDEPSEPFSTFTPEENTEDERLGEKQPATPERRLSFHNIESQEKEAESIYNSRKDTYVSSSKEEAKTSEAKSKENEFKHKKEVSDNRQSVISGGDEQITKVRSHSPIQFENSQSNSVSVNGGSLSKKDNVSRNHMSFEKETYKYSRKHSEKHTEADSRHNFAPNESRNHSKNLSEGDLRYELKKRMQEKPLKTIVSRSPNDSVDHHRSAESNRNHVRLRRSHSSEDSDHMYRHKSRDHRFHDRKSRAQSHSSSGNDRSVSPSRNHVSHSRSQTDTRTNRNRKRESSHSSDRSYKRSRSQSPEQRNAAQSRGPRRHSGSSSSSTSSSSSKSSSRSPRLRLVSSVVKPVARTDDSKTHSSDVSEKHPLSSVESSSTVVFKRRRNSDEKPKILSSAVKSSVCGAEKLANTTDTVKRVPVHMRLGTLPHKRIIRMTKDVEAAFVSTSSDEETDVNLKYKKQNYRVITELSGNKLDEVSKRHVEKGTCRNADVFKGRRMKIER